jgi:uncharacterized protein (UPF0332 family)
MAMGVASAGGHPAPFVRGEHPTEQGDLDPEQGRAVRRAFELCRRADGGTELPVDREEATELLDRTMWFLDAVEGALGQAGA